MESTYGQRVTSSEL